MDVSGVFRGEGEMGFYRFYMRADCCFSKVFPACGEEGVLTRRSEMGGGLLEPFTINYSPRRSRLITNPITVVLVFRLISFFHAISRNVEWWIRE